MGYPEDFVDDAVKESFDPRRTRPENMLRIHDTLSQFGSPHDRDGQQEQDFALEDAIRRKEGSIAEQAARRAGLI
jgi:hypothetical protein